MSNRSNLYFEDDLKDLEQDNSVYDSISARDPLEKVGMQGLLDQSQGSEDFDLGLDDESLDDLEDADDLEAVAPPVTGAMPANAKTSAVMQAIANSRQPNSTPAKSDPFMDQYLKSESDLRELRKAKGDADLIANLGQAFSQIAQGSNTPKPNNALYEGMLNQNAAEMKSGEADLERKQKVLQAIELRKSREAIASGNRDFKERALAAQLGARANITKNKSDQLAKTNDFKSDRLLSGMGDAFEHDPILKPSQVNLASLQKMDSILTDTSLPLTSQSLSDGELDLAGALTLRPNVISEGKIKRTEIETLGRKIGELKQKYGGSMADMRKEAPETVAQLMGLNRILREDYENAINKRSTELVAKKKALVDNPRVHAGLDRYLQTQLIPKKAGEHAKPKGGSSNAGKYVTVKGKLYRVGADGDSLEEAM